MSATREKPPKHERPYQPSAPLAPVFRPRDRTLAIALLVGAFFMALQSAGIASYADGVSSLGAILLLWPLLTLAMLVIVWAVRYAERLIKKSLPGLRVGLTLAVVALATFAVAIMHNDHQRCVDKNTMTVVAAADCQNQNAGTQGNQNQDAWYYGGRGIRVGDTVDKGSFTPPEEQGGNGGGDTGGAGGDGSE